MRPVRLAYLLLLLPAVAFAQSTEAGHLFEQGRTLIKRGYVAAGCDKLASSLQLEPRIGTLLNLGDCNERLGKMASAWWVFREAEHLASKSRREHRRQVEAARRVAALEPKLSRLAIEVRDPVDGLTIKRDGGPVPIEHWNAAIPLDPGSYTIVAEAPGFGHWQARVVVDGTQHSQVISIPPLEPILDTRRPVVLRWSTPIYRSRTWSLTRGIAAGVATIGVAALGTGAVFGKRARDLEGRADAVCPNAGCNDPVALSDNSDAHAAARKANLSFAIGGAALAVAGVVWWIGRPSDEVIVKPMFGDRAVGLTVKGRL